MPYFFNKEISKEIYDNAQKNNGYITDDDKKNIFSIRELCGYGIYGAQAYKQKEKYYCTYYRGSTCD